VPGRELVCYYDSRERWLERNGDRLKQNPAIVELSYLLPKDVEVLRTFEEVAATLAESSDQSRLIEAGDVEALCTALRTPPQITVFWNMTDGFRPVTASYFPALAAMTARRYFGNSAALQLSIQNKFIQYLMCKQLGIPTPETRLYDGDNFVGGVPLYESQQGLFVKPFDAANSIGIFPDSVCNTIEQARAITRRIKRLYGAKSLVQKYIKGRSVRVNYVAVNRAAPIPEQLGVHLMRGPPEDDFDFTTYEDYLERYERADAEYAAKAVATDLTDQNTDFDLKVAVAGIRTDIQKLVDCFGLRDFFSIDYKVTAGGERYFIELNTLPFARNAGLRAYCRERFGLSVGRALGTAIALSDPDGRQSEW
jgi:D-alanine-D-alanine ligase-like ATP-grasp enzyme